MSLIGSRPWLCLGLLFSVLFVGCFKARTEFQPRSTLPTVSGGGESVETVPTEVVATGSVGEQMAQLDSLMRQQGYLPGTPVMRAVVQPNGLQAYPMDLLPGTCVTTAVWGENNDQDLNIFLLDPYGREVQHNVLPDNHPWLSFCASTPGRYIVRIQPSAENGEAIPYRYVTYFARNAQRIGLSVFFGERPSDPAAEAQENFVIVNADMHARGYLTDLESEAGALNTGETRDFAIRLRARRCYAFMAVGDRGISNLDLILQDASGQELASDRRSDARPTVRYCTRQAGNYRVQIQLMSGAGNFVYQPYRWPRGTSGPFGLEGVSWVRLSEITSLLGVEGYNPDPGYTPGEGELMPGGAIVSHELLLHAGQCYAIAVVGGEGVVNVDAVLTASGQLLGNDRGNEQAFTNVRYCIDQDLTMQLQVRASVGHGHYHYQVFSRPRDAS